MKKIFLFIAFEAAFFVSGVSFAQTKKPGFTLGVSGFYANPQNNFKNTYKSGLGGEVKGGVGLGKTYIIATLGYASFSAQPGYYAGRLNYIPAKVGIKHYLLLKRLFINGDAGVASLKKKLMSSAESRFSADIGAGVRLLGMEAGIYYDSWKNLNGNGSSNSVELKLGYNITL